MRLPGEGRLSGSSPFLLIPIFLFFFSFQDALCSLPPAYCICGHTPSPVPVGVPARAKHPALDLQGAQSGAAIKCQRGKEKRAEKHVVVSEAVIDGGDVSVEEDWGENLLPSGMGEGGRIPERSSVAA